MLKKIFQVSTMIATVGLLKKATSILKQTSDKSMRETAKRIEKEFPAKR